MRKHFWLSWGMMLTLLFLMMNVLWSIMAAELTSGAIARLNLGMNIIFRDMAQKAEFIEKRSWQSVRGRIEPQIYLLNLFRAEHAPEQRYQLELNSLKRTLENMGVNMNAIALRVSQAGEVLAEWHQPEASGAFIPASSSPGIINCFQSLGVYIRITMELTDFEACIPVPAENYAQLFGDSVRFATLPDLPFLDAQRYPRTSPGLPATPVVTTDIEPDRYVGTVVLGDDHHVVGLVQIDALRGKESRQKRLMYWAIFGGLGFFAVLMGILNLLQPSRRTQMIQRGK